MNLTIDIKRVITEEILGCKGCIAESDNVLCKHIVKNNGSCYSGDVEYVWKYAHKGGLDE